MTLREKQSLFAFNLSMLIQFAYENGYEITMGEAFRTKCQQYLYFCGYKIMEIGSSLKLAKTSQKSKTMSSLHLLKLACDINLFKDGTLLSSKEDFKLLSTYWKGLHSGNTCGYFWGWDFGHFQMNK